MGTFCIPKLLSSWKIIKNTYTMGRPFIQVVSHSTWLHRILIYFLAFLPSFRVCVPLPTAAANWPRGLNFGMKLGHEYGSTYITYISVSKSIPLAVTAPPWAAGESNFFSLYRLAAGEPICGTSYFAWLNTWHMVKHWHMYHCSTTQFYVTFRKNFLQQTTQRLQ